MILVLGGTAQARELAAQLVAAGNAVTTSLAGRVANPRLPAGEVRTGGFGGVEGFSRWLREHPVAAVIDATHPFAQQISANAVCACDRAQIPLLRLQRPGWTERPGDRWTWVDDLDAAAREIPGLGTRVLLTSGRQGLASFREVEHAWFLIRCVDPPEVELPVHHQLLLDRGPYTLAGEGSLIDTHRIDLVITKDSGGEHTVAKLDAARARGLPVIIVRRPPRPRAETVETADDALVWALSHTD